MIKPAYAAMRTASGSTICFVPSRSQCRSTANDLVTQTATDLEESFVVGSLDMIEAYSRNVSDPDLAEALSHGIAVFHEGLQPEEQRLALELFGSGAVRILIASREACWTLPVTASLVIVLSAQYAIVRSDNEREIKEYALPELLQMQSLAIPPRSDATAEFVLLCQKEQAELYSRFLLQGGPLESELPFDGLMTATLFNDILERKIKTRQDVIDLLSWTYASHRLASNPSYYTRGEPSNQFPPTHDDQISRLGDKLLTTLESRCCLLLVGKTGFEVSQLGRYFSQKGVGLDVVEEIQGVEIGKLVDLSSSLSNGVVHSAGQDEALKAFHSRLPRAVRDTIGEEKEGAEAGSHRRRILLAAFCASRIPRGSGGLEEEQASYVEKVMGGLKK
jgi:antiviral helicase SLH1